MAGPAGRNPPCCGSAGGAAGSRAGPAGLIGFPAIAESPAGSFCQSSRSAACFSTSALSVQRHRSRLLAPLVARQIDPLPIPREPELVEEPVIDPDLRPSPPRAPGSRRRNHHAPVPVRQAPNGTVWSVKYALAHRALLLNELGHVDHGEPPPALRPQQQIDRPRRVGVRRIEIDVGVGQTRGPPAPTAPSPAAAGGLLAAFDHLQHAVVRHRQADRSPQSVRRFHRSS